MIPSQKSFDETGPHSKHSIKFDYEYCETQEEVREHIQECEGHHTQQAIYSTFHDALTQVCYGCLKVRTTIKR